MPTSGMGGVVKVTDHGSRSPGPDITPALCMSRKGASIHDDSMLETTNDHKAAANRMFAGTYLCTIDRLVTFHDVPDNYLSSHDSTHNFEEIMPPVNGCCCGVAMKNGPETSSS